MRRYFLVAVVTAAAATLTGSAPAGGAPAGVAAPGAQLWVARFRAGGSTQSSAMAVSPAGGRVFVSGEIYGGRATGVDYETVAFSAATGRRLWFSRYSGPGDNDDTVSAVAVSPDGRMVFVTGYTSSTWNARSDYATVAYSAATGRQLWVSRYNGPANKSDGAGSVAVSPGGGTVYVAGGSDGRTGGQSDYATVAYSAATGRQLWVRRYNGPADGIAGAYSVAVSPAGGRVFVTGYASGWGTGADDATVAYSAATGRQLWASHYKGPANGDDDFASSVAVSPGGGRVYVAGTGELAPVNTTRRWPTAPLTAGSCGPAAATATNPRWR